MRPPYSLCALSLALAFVSHLDSLAGEQQFPYQAVVVTEQAEVRCGPGARFYVTSVAKLNEPVTVHRHDHGGWYMIAPPPGSVSWIEADCVERTGGHRGVVSIEPNSGRPSRVKVRIGSQLSDDHSFSGRELSNGDEVTILGEQTFSSSGVPTKMFKIAPPAQEFRWVKGECLAPVSRQIQQQLAVNPYEVPVEHRSRVAAQTLESAPKMVAAAPVLAAPAESPALPAPAPAPASADFDALDAIDQQYARMSEGDPAQWDFDSIVRDYQKLAQSSSPRVGKLVEQRMEIVRQRQEIAHRYRKFAQVSAEASQRDAQLVAQHGNVQLMSGEAFPGPVVAAAEEVRSADAGALPPLMAPPEGNEPGLLPPETQLIGQLCGAGVVQQVQAPSGNPRFALVSPSGQVLAFLEAPPEMKLQAWAGKSAGAIGQRSPDAALGRDVIRVQKLVPVQLAR